MAPLRAGTIPMSLTRENVELRVSVMADIASMRWLGASILGDAGASSEMLDDVLRELANTAGGVLKRTALTEGVTLTTGIPTTRALADRPTDAAMSAWVIDLAGGEATVAVVVEVWRTKQVRLEAAKLCEGMVVTRDLLNAAGAILLPAGTCLTSNLAARVVQNLGGRFVVEVARAA